ncbi:MAG: RHS repeat-associated core domain-containing protein [Gammaproteobacteria bacterium]|nr:RHS repeat-associated core domain-containing protein [Gammaproteobacteria bacterium]
MMNSLKTIALALLIALVSKTSWAAQTVTYYHLDAHGSTIAATNEQGNLMWREAYEPYGVRLRKESTSSNTTWYTGKQEDAGAGLSYFGARWYDPELGRFMGIDPVGFKESSLQTFNRYAYANNNPYKFVDPDGRDAVGIVYDGYQVNTGFGFKLALGHAGVLLIDNNSGGTKYYEYGRYSPNGKGIMGKNEPPPV